MTFSRLVTIGLAFVTITCAFSQDAKPPPISTDRPTFCDSSSLSGLDWWQIESGSTYTHLPGGSLTTLGEFTLRRQISQNIELRIVDLSLGFPAQGAAELVDPGIGFKYRLLTGTARRPEVTAIVLTSIPAGGPEFRTNAFQPTAKIAWTQAISGTWSIAGNFIFSRAGSGIGAFDQWSGGVFFSETLKGPTSAFYEVYAQNTEGAASPGAVFGDVGLLRLLGNNCQLDARIGSASNEKSNGWFVGAGVSWRF